MKKALITVPVRKPDRQSFVRVHPDPSWRLDTAVINLKDERETYLVDPSLWPELPGELAPTGLFTAVTRQGVVFLWPVRLPGPDGRLDSWSRSALDAVEMAKQSWVRVAANMDLGAYDVFALHVGIALRFFAGLRRSDEVRLNLSRLQALGLDRYAASRGLHALETAGLVSVDRHAGRVPRVTLLAAPSSTRKVEGNA